MKGKRFLSTSYDLMEHETFRQLMAKGKCMRDTFEWLRKNIIRASMENIYCKEVYKEYYLKGYLAATVGEEKLAKDLFISRSCVRNNLKNLEEAGFIKIKELKSKSRGEGAQKKQKVYLMGKWVLDNNKLDSKKPTEFLYAYDILKTDIFVKNTENFRKTYRFSVCKKTFIE